MECILYTCRECDEDFEETEAQRTPAGELECPACKSTDIVQKEPDDEEDDEDEEESEEALDFDDDEDEDDWDDEDEDDEDEEEIFY